MEEPVSLELLSEKTLHQTAEPQLLSYCPSMDLVALGNADQQVLIYRFNGQHVYALFAKPGTLQIESLAWKPNGRYLATAWSNGTVRLLGAESNKILHQFSMGEGMSKITCIGWASNRTRRDPKAPGLDNDLKSWEALLSDDQTASNGKIPLDLPRGLALIDIETSLPKISVLAVGGGPEDVFGSRPSLDACFAPFAPRDYDSVDVIVAGTMEGNIRLSIYNSFLVGSFKSPPAPGDLSSHLVFHAYHESYSTHALLLRSSAAEEKLYFAPMDLRFISASSDYLSILASRSTLLQNLTKYIQQVQILMVNEWRGTQELAARFLRNINETLAEDRNRDIVQALYHSVATGHTFPAVREWLVDELAERGHKRWDKAVTTALGNLKRLVHENMIPALERCSLILSRFAGIAKFQDPHETVGFSSQQINLLMDTVACLHLVSSKIQIQVVDELDLFTSFSAWLRYEIDRLASDSSSVSPSEEMTDKEALIDHSKVLLYLQTVITSSRLAVFFGEATSKDEELDKINVEQGLPMFATLDDQLRKQEQGLPYIKHLPRVDFLFNTLNEQAKTIYGHIAEAERRNVLFGKVAELGSVQHGVPLDMKIYQIDQSSFYTHVAFVPSGKPNQVQIIRITLIIINGISTVQNIDSFAVQLGNGQVKDAKFAANHTLLVLWESAGATSLLGVPHKIAGAKNAAEGAMSYSPHTTDHPPHSIVFSNKELVERFLLCRLPSEESFVPEKMEIREPVSQKRKDETGRIVFLGKDKLQYKVYRFPNQQKSKGKAADEDISMS